MVARVALATCSSIPCICKNKAGFQGMPCLERGRRGVEAMRVPTAAMVKVGVAVIPGTASADVNPLAFPGAIEDVYTAMIDAALNDGPAPTSAPKWGTHNFGTEWHLERCEGCSCTREQIEDALVPKECPGAQP